MNMNILGIMLTYIFITMSLIIVGDALILCAFGMSTGFTDGIIDILTIITGGK